MPRRLTEAEARAARRAGTPPVKKEVCAHPLNDWHKMQESWLKQWRPAAVLPDKKDKERRRAWQDLVKTHARHCKVRTSSPSHAAPPLPTALVATLPLLVKRACTRLCGSHCALHVRTLDAGGAEPGARDAVLRAREARGALQRLGLPLQIPTRAA